jgi:hypothetical protein
MTPTRAPDSSPDPKQPRATLKLKASARKSPEKSESAPAPRPQTNSKLRPGAHWSDEFKERMQADMDALLR